jgi:uncharacterized repeat protein (TIGR01451 family)
MMGARLFLAALLLPLLLLASPAARAACDANNTYRFAYSSLPAGSLNYANTYTYTATNGLGATQNFTTRFTTNGLNTNVVNSVALPAIANLITTSTGANTLVVGGIFSGRTASITGATRVITIIFTFTQPVRDFAFTVHDADYTNNQYRDWIHISGSNGATTYTPTLTTPHGTNNGAGPRSSANSSLTLGPATSPFNLTALEGLGTGASANNNVNTGDVTASFAQPVTTITMRYGNYPYQSGESSTGQQAMGISALSFCPMPALAIAKSSAPYATSGPDRFNAPGSDVVYTLTATNSGGSPVDASSLVLTDVLPAGVTFYNGDFNPASPGMGPFELVAGTSAVTLPASGRAYSNNGGGTYAYMPAAGYDANVDAVRLTPSGSMAANSSFTIRFRARVD